MFPLITLILFIVPDVPEWRFFRKSRAIRSGTPFKKKIISVPEFLGGVVFIKNLVFYIKSRRFSRFLVEEEDMGRQTTVFQVPSITHGFMFTWIHVHTGVPESGVYLRLNTRSQIMYVHQ